MLQKIRTLEIKFFRHCPCPQVEISRSDSSSNTQKSPIQNFIKQFENHLVKTLSQKIGNTPVVKYLPCPQMKDKTGWEEISQQEYKENEQSNSYMAVLKPKQLPISMYNQENQIQVVFKQKNKGYAFIGYLSPFLNLAEVILTIAQYFKVQIYEDTQVDMVKHQYRDVCLLSLLEATQVQDSDCECFVVNAFKEENRHRGKVVPTIIITSNQSNQAEATRNEDFQTSTRAQNLGKNSTACERQFNFRLLPEKKKEQIEEWKRMNRQYWGIPSDSLVPVGQSCRNMGVEEIEQMMGIEINLSQFQMGQDCFAADVSEGRQQFQ